MSEVKKTISYSEEDIKNHPFISKTVNTLSEGKADEILAVYQDQRNRLVILFRSGEKLIVSKNETVRKEFTLDEHEKAVDYYEVLLNTVNDAALEESREEEHEKAVDYYEVLLNTVNDAALEESREEEPLTTE